MTPTLDERCSMIVARLGEGDPAADQAAAELIAELQALLTEPATDRRLVGSLIGRIQAARRTAATLESINWTRLRAGALALGHRPRLKSFPAMQGQGATHILTLLTSHEGADEIGADVKKAGLTWLWFPLEGGDPLPPESLPAVRQLYRELGQILDEGGKIYVHCSAGIHPTGMMTYGLLRSLGLPGAEAEATLRSLRSTTAEGVGTARLQWGDQFGAAS